ncbi:MULTISPECIES: RDD family protein [Gordonia]|uniref:RDD family protein n=1 Tax=Gordonia TaxID=2053 RepID=UPI0030FEC298
MTNPPGNPGDPNAQPDPYGATQFGQTPNFEKQPQTPPASPDYGQQPPAYGQPVPPAYGQPGQPAYGQQPYGAFGQENAGFAGQQGGEWNRQPDGSVSPGAVPAGFTPQANTGYVDIVGLGRVQVADIGKRFLARLIDGVIYGVIYGIMFGVGAASIVADPIECSTNSFGTTTCDGGGAGVMGFFVVMLLAMAFGLLYEWLMIGIKGATLGKMAMHIKVVDQLSGQPIGLGRAFVRQIIPFAGAIACYVGAIVVYLSPLFDNSGRMQGWHDKAANDLVIISG